MAQGNRNDDDAADVAGYFSADAVHESTGHPLGPHCSPAVRDAYDAEAERLREPEYRRRRDAKIVKSNRQAIELAKQNGLMVTRSSGQLNVTAQPVVRPVAVAPLTRARGAGRPPARRATSSAARGSPDDPDPEPPHPLAPPSGAMCWCACGRDFEPRRLADVQCWVCRQRSRSPYAPLGRKAAE
jgi:hypothetical protein